MRTLSLRPMKRLGIAAAVAFLAVARPASAHPIPFSYLDLRVPGLLALGGTIRQLALVVTAFTVAH